MKNVSSRKVLSSVCIIYAKKTSCVLIQITARETRHRRRARFVRKKRESIESCVRHNRRKDKPFFIRRELCPEKKNEHALNKQKSWGHESGSIIVALDRKSRHRGAWSPLRLLYSCIYIYIISHWDKKGYLRLTSSSRLFLWIIIFPRANWARQSREIENSRAESLFASWSHYIASAELLSAVPIESISTHTRALLDLYYLFLVLLDRFIHFPFLISFRLCQSRRDGLVLFSFCSRILIMRDDDDGVLEKK